jgi:hypothetical protein
VVSVNLVVASKEGLILVYGPPDVDPRYTLYPATVALSVQVKVAECVTSIPVPESEIVDDEFEALLVMLTFPVTLPDAAGASVTFIATDAPGG